jgi:GntR family transcriptional regulator, transcriptional repressor for pyruvate dehydrogenase complex
MEAGSANIRLRTTRPSPTIRRRKVSVSGFSRVQATPGDLVEAVAGQVLARIEEGLFRHGERLPSERDLATELGISRPVLREGLGKLESLGYLEARVGQGRFVVDPREGWRSQRLIDDWLRQHQSELRDLIELRAAVESQALRGASRDPRKIAHEVRDLVAAQSAAVAAGRPDDAAAIDVEFHRRLCGGTENQPLRALADSLIGRTRQAAHATYRVTTYQRSSLRQHRLIVAALRAGDLGRAADLVMEHHLSRVDQLASYLEQAAVSRTPTERAADPGPPDAEAPSQEPVEAGSGMARGSAPD